MAATRNRTNKRPTVRKKAAPRPAGQPAASALNRVTTPALVAASDAPALVGVEADWEAFARLADARDRSADIIDSAREQAATVQTEAESAAARTVTDTHTQVLALLSDAQTRAAGITTGAEEEAAAQRTAAQAAQAGLESARGEADRLVAEARERAETIVREARAQVTDLTELAATDRQATATAVAELRRLAEADLTEIAALVETRRTEASGILARAQEQADELVAAAQREVEQARERFAQLAKAAGEQYDGRRAEAEALYADAVTAAGERRREADAHVAAAHSEAEQARTELREKLRELTDHFDSEAAAKREALTGELAALKAACDQQREKLREEAKTVAVQLREAARKEAERITTEAERKAKAVTDRAKADESRARRLLEEAREAKRAASRWRGWQDNLSRKVWKTAPWVALAAGVGLAASGEYELARMVGINDYVAPLLPVSIDVYCVTAFRAKKDIPYALLLMASANVTYHLCAQAGTVQKGHAAPWQLTTFVVLIFVAVIWRVHSLMHNDSTDKPGRTESEDGRTGTEEGSGTPARTGTHRRTQDSDAVPSGRTGSASTDLYGPRDGAGRSGAGAGRVGTDPVRRDPRPARDGGGEAGLNWAYSDRTDAVHTAPDGAARTGTPVQGRPGTASPAVQVRTGIVSARTQSGAEGVPGARTGTDAASSPANGTSTAGGAERPGTPVRTDEELLPLVQNLRRDKDGFVTLYRARTELSVNNNRAVRLLSKAGLLRPEDADKHLS